MNGQHTAKAKHIVKPLGRDGIVFTYLSGIFHNKVSKNPV